MSKARFTLAAFTLLAFGVALWLTAEMPGQQPAQPAPQPGPIKGKGKKAPVTPPEFDTSKDDVQIVAQAGLKGEGPDLLEYFKKRTLKAPDPKEIEALVKQLGDDDFQAREKAYLSLMTMGASALAGLKAGENDPDLEVRKRVADLKQRIDTKAEPTLQAAAARLIAKTNPQGAAEALMAYLPFASDPMVVDEICRTLGAVALRDDKVEPVLVKSLEDPIAIKRAAAGEALARAEVKEQLPAIKKLLADKDLSVRFRVCMAMLGLKDKDVVPVMIDLLQELPANQLWPIEEALLRLAGEKAPQVSLGTDAASRKNTRDVWAKWYAENEKTIDMAKLTADNVYLGYTLIVQHNNRIGVGGGNVGEVFELDKDKNVRWKFTMAQGYPVDAQMIGPNRVLVCEYQGGKVTERDLKGEVKWEHACGGNPFAAQRLPNGNTFIVMQGRLIEVDRNRNEVWSYQRPNQDIMRARKLPTGEVVFITNIGAQATYTRMDAKTQKVNKTFNVMQTQMLFGNVEVLPNGNIIVPHYNQHRVTEYKDDGSQVTTTNLNWPNSVVRLPNGNNLITSYNQRQVYEYRGNQQVWNFATDGLVFVARRR